MLKDIKVELINDVHVAIVPETGVIETSEYFEVYFYSKRKTAISNILISAISFGKQGDKKVKTSRLVYQKDHLEPKGFFKFELLTKEHTKLFNEFLISFVDENKLLDRKIVFLPEVFKKGNLIPLPFIKKEGILI